MCLKIDWLLGLAGLLFAGVLLDILGIMKITPNTALLLGSLGTTLVVLWGIMKEQAYMDKFESQLSPFFEKYGKITRIPTRQDIRKIARKRRKR